MDYGVKIDKYNTKLPTQNFNKGKISIQLQSFIDFQVIRKKHEQSINRTGNVSKNIPLTKLLSSETPFGYSRMNAFSPL